MARPLFSVARPIFPQKICRPCSSFSKHDLKDIFPYRGAYIRTGQKYEAHLQFAFLSPVLFFLQKFVARPIFRINIYSSYFMKIEKMLARPKNHQKSDARPILARPVRKKRVLALTLYTPHCIDNSVNFKFRN